MSKLLEVKNLNISFGDQKVVNSVSFDIDKGETVALVGESGSGKSVSALATVRLLPDTAEVNGSVRYCGTDMLNTDAHTLARVRGNDISFIFQEPMTSLNPLHCIEKQIGESLALHQGCVGKAAQQRIINLLDKVGIEQPHKRLLDYPHQLSGGQRQRVMIAIALANKPELLIADEPTTALDVTIQAQILDLLAQLQKSEGLGLLFITHDLAVVRAIADRVNVMQDGKIVEAGDKIDIFTKPKHAYTKMLLDAEPVGDPEPIAKSAPEVIAVTDLRVWFPVKRGFLRRTVSHIHAVNQACFTVRAGETLGVVGESGSGKTTLALALLRLVFSEGSIVFLSKNVQGLKSRHLKSLRRNMQMVFQDPYGSLSPRMTVGEIIAEGLRVHKGRDQAAETAAVAAILSEVGLSKDIIRRYPHEFSGGQRQRIAIARAMILRPRLLVLDEPTSALDVSVQVKIVNLLRSLQKKYQLAYIFISHDLRIVRALSHNIIVMRNGDIIEAGPREQIFERPHTVYTRTLINAAFNLVNTGNID